ncbi:DUF59 domain-containing protein [Candidatus Micrarchaeota archaeon]|nr:DUF59 domain-containing protein [Candidatus Micrarchaeota archaeon]
MKELTIEDIKEALSKANHPEINYNLLELGMIRDIRLNNSDVQITLAVPYLYIPIREDLINIIKESIAKNEIENRVDVEVVEMNNEEKETFMRMAQKGWKF